MNESIEQQIQQNGETAPCVTQADVEAAIASAHCFTGTEGVLGLLIFCVLFLRNCFTVTGESDCVSPENFDAPMIRVGKKAAGRRLDGKLHDEYPNRVRP